jgi:hypothetical protein
MQSVISTASFMMAVMQSSLCLMYIEPLDEQATRAFVFAHASSIGSPLIAIALGMLHGVLFLAIFVFAHYGATCGLLSAAFTVGVIGFIFTTWFELSAWKNPMLFGMAERPGDTILGQKTQPRP